MILSDRYAIKKRKKIKEQTDWKAWSLTGFEAQLRGQLVALSGLRLVSSEKEESISAWYLDKCWVWEIGTANVQNNTYASTSKEGLWYILWTINIPTLNQIWNIMSERQIYYTYFTD